jgi:hypothetical protein
MSVLDNFFQADVSVADVVSGIKKLTPLYDEQVKPLLKNGRDLSLAERMLLVAAGDGNLNVVKGTIEAGADVNCVSDGYESNSLAILAGLARRQQFG